MVSIVYQVLKAFGIIEQPLRSLIWLGRLSEEVDFDILKDIKPDLGFRSIEAVREEWRKDLAF
jgi:hypothetical protein